MRGVFVAVLFVLTGSVCLAQGGKPQASKGKDGFPSGHSTPEGAACDLARAFINRDAVLFKATCVKPFGGGENRKAYEAFLTRTAQMIGKESKKKIASPYGPKSIETVFTSRHLSKSGPASYGYAMFDFKDVKFVDVSVVLQNGKQGMNRTLVLQEPDGRWYVHPLPSASPLLSDGLNQETASSQKF